MVGNHKAKKLAEAKPEIPAPILDSFPPLLPPVTVCDAAVKGQTGFQPITSLIKLQDFSMTGS